MIVYVHIILSILVPPINDTTKELPGQPNKYKGFYSMR